MALLDFLKKRKKGAQKGRPLPKRDKDKDKDSFSLAKKAPEIKGKLKKEGSKRKSMLKFKESAVAWRVLLKPHVTEKSSDLTDLNKYTFKIFDNATKTDVSRAVSELYGVNVEQVRKIKVSRKKRQRPTRGSRRVGWKSSYTKAIVTLRKGDKIEVLPH